MIEQTLERLIAALERNANLMGQALGKKAAPAAEAPAAEPAPAEEPKRGRGRPPKAAEPPKKAGPTQAEAIAAAQKFLAEAEDPKAARAFMKAMNDHLGVAKVSEADAEHAEAIIVWFEAKARGVDVDFRMDLDDIRNAEPEEGDLV